MSIFANRLANNIVIFTFLPFLIFTNRITHIDLLTVFLWQTEHCNTMKMANKCKQQIKPHCNAHACCAWLETPSCLTSIFYLWYYLIYSSGAWGVSAKVDVVPGHAMGEHKLGDGLLEKGKGRGSHDTRAIIRAWHQCAKGLLVEKGSNLFCSNGCKRKLCFGVLHPIDEGHHLNEACGICFSASWDVHF